MFPGQLLFPGRTAPCLMAWFMMISTSPPWWVTAPTFSSTRRPATIPAESNGIPSYLLHGFSDDASGWTAVGHANVILDNLIAQGKAKPMLVVMPLGYGAPEVLAPGGSSDPAIQQRNLNGFARRYSGCIPQVEAAYRISKDRNSHAIAGLSMGGAESLLTGLNTLGQFAWIGAFSSGKINKPFDKEFPALDSTANQRLHLLWIACGTEDHLIGANREFRAWLASKGIQHVDIETPGAHTWMVWRRNLTEFAPLLFR